MRQPVEIDFLKECFQRIEEQRMLQALTGNPPSPDLVRLGPGACLSLWAAGIGPVRIDVLAVEVAGRRLSPSYLSNPDANGVRQVNIMIPLDLAAGETDLFLVADERRSMGRRLNLLNP